MQVLFPTGHQSESMLRAALSRVTEFTYEIVSVGEIASFLSPQMLEKLIHAHPCDLAVVSGMCTADFSSVEKTTGTLIRRGTRHAADMGLAVPLILSSGLSRDTPADDLLAEERRELARIKLLNLETAADAAFTIRGVKFGGGSRIKVVHEIMDAHRHPDLRDAVLRAIGNGADVVDLGFGFDATVRDVQRCFADVADLPVPLSIDTIDLDLIRASLFRADLVISLTSETIPLLASDVLAAGAAAVLIPGAATLADTISLAREHGLTRILADPLLQPPLSGFVSSLAGYLPDIGCPKILGCVNVVEMTDADSPGMCALLAAAAAESGSACVLISEHSDKTRGSTREMRRACEMMLLSRGRPYPKDVGVDVLLLKEKRRRQEPELSYTNLVHAPHAPDDLSAYDPAGNFRIGIEDGCIVAVRHNHAISGTSWYDVFSAILAEEGVSLLDHAAYLGKELYKAELALRYGRSFEQDGEF